MPTNPKVKAREGATGTSRHAHVAHTTLTRAAHAFLVALLCAAATALALPSSALAADSSSDDPADAVFEQLEGKTAGVLTGTPQDQIVKSKVDDIDLEYYGSTADTALALESNKIDCFLLASANYASIATQYPDFAYIKQPMTTFETGAIFPKDSDGDALRKEFNAYIKKIKASGELDELVDRWINSTEWDNVDIPENGEKGTITMATSTTFKPFSFTLNGEPTGFDIAIVAGFCKDAGYGLKIEDVDFAGVLSGIATNKYDIAAGEISWTEARTRSVSFSETYYTLQIVAYVSEEDYEGSDFDIVTSDEVATSGTSSNGGGIVDSIRHTVLDEDRWEQILEGLGVTLLITAGGFALANVLGAVFCAASMSRSRVLRALATAYSALMQGLPVVVILMLLYYVAFGRTRVDNVLVSMAGFGLVFGAFLSSLFKVGIDSVDRGQVEAALATGLTERQAFLGILLPQAVRSVLPSYFSNLISLMKSTSVVGYIAVMDLTQVGDVIRSSTFEAFVPLVTVALIYLAISGLMLLALRLLQARLDPRRKRPGHSLATTPTKGGLA